MTLLTLFSPTGNPPVSAVFNVESRSGPRPAAIWEAMAGYMSVRPVGEAHICEARDWASERDEGRFEGAILGRRDASVRASPDEAADSILLSRPDRGERRPLRSWRFWRDGEGAGAASETLNRAREGRVYRMM